MRSRDGFLVVLLLWDLLKLLLGGLSFLPGGVLASFRVRKFFLCKKLILVFIVFEVYV